MVPVHFISCGCVSLCRALWSQTSRLKYFCEVTWDSKYWCNNHTQFTFLRRKLCHCDKFSWGQDQQVIDLSFQTLQYEVKYLPLFIAIPIFFFNNKIDTISFSFFHSKLQEHEYFYNANSNSIPRGTGQLCFAHYFLGTEPIMEEWQGLS